MNTYWRWVNILSMNVSFSPVCCTIFRPFSSSVSLRPWNWRSNSCPKLIWSRPEVRVWCSKFLMVILATSKVELLQMFPSDCLITLLAAACLGVNADGRISVNNLDKMSPLGWFFFLWGEFFWVGFWPLGNFWWKNNQIEINYALKKSPNAK